MLLHRTHTNFRNLFVSAGIVFDWFSLLAKELSITLCNNDDSMPLLLYTAMDVVEPAARSFSLKWNLRCQAIRKVIGIGRNEGRYEEVKW